MEQNLEKLDSYLTYVNLTQEEIETYNKTSKVQIVENFAPEKITTLLIGSGIVESEQHFFGGRSVGKGQKL